MTKGRKTSFCIVSVKVRANHGLLRRKILSPATFSAKESKLDEDRNNGIHLLTSKLHFDNCTLRQPLWPTLDDLGKLCHKVPGAQWNKCPSKSMFPMIVIFTDWTSEQDGTGVLYHGGLSCTFKWLSYICCWDSFVLGKRQKNILVNNNFVSLQSLRMSLEMECGVCEKCFFF